MANEVAVKSDYQVLVQDTKAIAEALRDNVGQVGEVSKFDLDRVRMPGSAGRTWTVPSIGGDLQMKEIDGIIVHFRDIRAYWTQRLGANGSSETPPDCASEDTLTGVGTPGGVCAKCPFSQWGSDPDGGKGQACQLKRLLFVVRQENVLPFLLQLPATSLKNAKQYFLRLAGSGAAFHGVVTRIALETDKSANGIAYSKATFSMVRRLTKEEHEGIRGYAATIKSVIDRVKIGAEDYVVSDDREPGSEG